MFNAVIRLERLNDHQLRVQILVAASEREYFARVRSSQLDWVAELEDFQVMDDMRTLVEQLPLIDNPALSEFEVGRLEALSRQNASQPICLLPPRNPREDSQPPTRCQPC